MDDSAQKPRLREQVREVIRTRRYSLRTEKSYWFWIRYFIRFHAMQHPSTLGSDEVRQFLTWLATKRGVSAAAQNRALIGLAFHWG